MDLLNPDPLVVQRRVDHSMEKVDELFQKTSFSVFNRMFAFFDNPRFVEKPVSIPKRLQSELDQLGFRKLGVLKVGVLLGPQSVEFVDPSGLMKLQYYTQSGRWYLGAYTEDGHSVKSGPTKSGNAFTTYWPSGSLLEAHKAVKDLVEKRCNEQDLAPLYFNDQASLIKLWGIFHRISVPWYVAMFLNVHVYMVVAFAVYFFMRVAGII